MFLKHYIYLNLAASVFLYINGNVTSNESEHGECILPNYPQNGKWVIIGGSDASPGSTVPFNTIISFLCDEPYKVSGEYSMIMCLGKDWNLPSPDCSNSEKYKAKRQIIINGNEYSPIEEDGRRPYTYSRNRITVGGRGNGGVVVESQGRRLDVNNRQDGNVNWYGNDGTGVEKKRITIGGRDGGVVIEREGELVRGKGQNGISIGKKKITVGANGGGILIESDGELVGERGESEILIGIGGKRVKVNPGEQGTIYIDERGVVTKGNGYRGVTRKNPSQSDDDSSDDESDDGIEQEGTVRKVQNIDVRSSGGDAIVVENKRGRGRIVLGSGSTIIGIGEGAGSERITYLNKRETHSEEENLTLESERIRRSPASSKKKNKNVSEDEDGQDGEDGIVVQKGDSLDGYVIGIGQPGQSGTSRGGRGGTGAVIKGGKINGAVIGIGGQGGSAGPISSNKKQQKGEQDKSEESSTTKKPKSQNSKGSKSRIKRNPQQVLRFGVGIKIIRNSQGGILVQTTNEQRLTDNGVNIPLGGQGGQGVSGLDPSKIKGVVIDVQGVNGNTYFARRRRDIEEGHRSNPEDKKEATKERNKRQLTIAGLPFSGGQPIVVGGRGGDGLIIDGGVIHGNVVGTGGNGGNPHSIRKRNQVIEKNLQEEIEDVETRARNGTSVDLSSGAKLRIKRAREGRRGRGEQQGIMRQFDDGEYTLGGAEGGIIERSRNTVRRLGTNDEGGIREIALNGDRGRDSGRDSGRDDPDIDVRGGSRDDDDTGKRSQGVRCPALRNDDMVSVTCYNDRSRIVSCETATAGTSVEYKCANFYEPPTMKYQTGYCYDGEWTVQKPTCVPVCGKARLDATPQIVGGDPSAKGDYPWVAAIFQNINNNFDNVCGGSILSQKIILTAAHCVTNEFGDALSTSLINVGVGKYYVGYRDQRDDEAQYSDVTQILVHRSYKGINQRFASDIALLVTKDTLKLSRLVQPVCYQDLPQFQLVNQMRGWVTGWGFTMPVGPQADVLKQLFVPYKDEATCRTEFPTEWLDDFLTYDKFCAGFFNKSVSVCRGDSGGGLVFRNTNGRFYVQGVVSLSMNTEFKCQIQYSTLYTRVSTHYGWIREIITLFG